MKRFIVKPYDADRETVWQVWGKKRFLGAMHFTYRYAEFYGNGAHKYAVEHARRLNELSKKEQPK